MEGLYPKKICVFALLVQNGFLLSMDALLFETNTIR
jgi:hypothetical protein